MRIGMKQAARLRGALRHELVLPDERSGRRTRRRTPVAATHGRGAATQGRGAAPGAGQGRGGGMAKRSRRRRPRGHPTRRTLHSSSTCRRRTESFSRSLPRSGSPTRRSSSSISTCRRSGRCAPSRSISATSDPFVATNRQLADALTRLDVPHTIEVYQGDHGNRIRERFEMHVLPFFSRHLDGTVTRIVLSITAGLVTLAASVHLAGLPRDAGAQTNRDRASATRTLWGDPDLQGEWTAEGEYGVPFEQPRAGRHAAVPHRPGIREAAAKTSAFATSAIWRRSTSSQERWTGRMRRYRTGASTTRHPVAPHW